MTKADPNELDLWRRALARRDSDGTLWRSARDLDEASPDASPEFREGVDQSPESDIGRRELFRLLGAGAALAGLSGCPERPRDDIVPYVARSPEQMPGQPNVYATSMVLDGFATGLLAESNGGRPTKLDGNPDHPASLGASGIFHQASVLELYDPNRAATMTHKGQFASFSDFRTRVGASLGSQPWFVLYPQSSPLVGGLIETIRAQIPEARFCFDSPMARTQVYTGARAAFGSPLETHYDFLSADRVVALDADFTSDMPNSLRWARDFAQRRRLRSPDDSPGRLYVVEPCPTPTGSIADHRLAIPGRDVVRVAAALLIELIAITGYQAPESVLRPARQLAGEGFRDWARVVARDLSQQRGRSIVIPGPRQPEATHVLCQAIHTVLGSFGSTVSLSESALLDPAGGASLEDLARELAEGTVETLAVLEGNPVYTAPVDLELGTLFAQAKQSVHLSLFRNETSLACDWLIPAAHYLESWSAGRAYDGTLSLVQPLLRARQAHKTVTELLAEFANNTDLDDHRRLIEHLRQLGISDDDSLVALQSGFVADSAFPRQAVPIRWYGVSQALSRALESQAGTGLELGFQSGQGVCDGRFANNAWLQELPHPLTKLTWGNAALISPRTAVAMGVESEQVIELALGARTLPVPALILPGHADNAITLATGYGRGGEESLASGVGVNANLLRRRRDYPFANGLTIKTTGQFETLALTQDHGRMHGREIALYADLGEYSANPDFTAAHRGDQPSWLPPLPGSSTGQQWAMSIDTSICTGCSSCVIACQAENNIPIVGKTGVEKSREMHWLRIDRYFAGPVADPIILNQPMMCQHCEKAPCEYVCPVYATTHSPDGLNEMVYNRCVGTRFCSNNCPYKVRRFNWFEYRKKETSSNLQLNPDVTVRSRGVMEKCTYCVQRIRRAGINARLDKRELRPDEVQSACQQACPTGAIQFGSLAHADTEMVKWRQEPRSYQVLHELGTRPRTVYLAHIRNPNPELG